MEGKPRPSPLAILLPVGIGTCLSLIGDASLYAVLPTHTQAAGVSVAAVGILLSANRFVRLVLNGPTGVAYGRFSRRRLFVLALFIGALSTAIYGLTQGFWPLLVGRLLWGLAWAGIWIGGNTIVADLSHEGSRGRWMGVYQGFFFLGAAGGSFLGGFLTDGIGYQRAMIVAAGLTLAGALLVLVCLPEIERSEPGARSSAPRVPLPGPGTSSGGASGDGWRVDRMGLSLGLAAAAPFALYGVNHLVVPGVLSSTLGLLLDRELGGAVELAGRSVGVATLTGTALGLSTLIAMVSAPVMGALSDRAANRWRVVVAGLVPGIAGFALLAVGSPLSIAVGVPLTALASGSNQSLSTTLIGDRSDAGDRSQRLGLLFTVGDLASAVGPPLAYALIPLLGIGGGYLLSAGAFALMSFAAVWSARVNGMHAARGGET